MKTIPLLWTTSFSAALAIAKHFKYAFRALTAGGKLKLTAKSAKPLHPQNKMLTAPKTKRWLASSSNRQSFFKDWKGKKILQVPFVAVLLFWLLEP